MKVIRGSLVLGFFQSAMLAPRRLHQGLVWFTLMLIVFYLFWDLFRVALLVCKKTSPFDEGCVGASNTEIALACTRAG